MPDQVLVVVKFKVPRDMAYQFVENLKETIDDFVVDENPDVELVGEPEIEDI